VLESIGWRLGIELPPASFTKCRDPLLNPEDGSRWTEGWFSFPVDMLPMAHWVLHRSSWYKGPSQANDEEKDIMVL
jgi:hypothetical protein